MAAASSQKGPTILIISFEGAVLRTRLTLLVLTNKQKPRAEQDASRHRISTGGQWFTIRDGSIMIHRLLLDSNAKLISDCLIRVFPS
jgi:hypothetical protein